MKKAQINIEYDGLVMTEWPVIEEFERFVCLNINGKHVDFTRSEVFLFDDQEKPSDLNDYFGTPGGSCKTPFMVR